MTKIIKISLILLIFTISFINCSDDSSSNIDRGYNEMTFDLTTIEEKSISITGSSTITCASSTSCVVALIKTTDYIGITAKDGNFKMKISFPYTGDTIPEGAATYNSSVYIYDGTTSYTESSIDLDLTITKNSDTQYTIAIAGNPSVNGFTIGASTIVAQKF